VGRHASLIKASQLDWSETKLSGQFSYSVADISLIAGKEYRLSLRWQRWTHPKLFRGQMIETLHNVRSRKRLGYQFGREPTIKFIVSNRAWKDLLR
jgi:hypothetical protein